MGTNSKVVQKTSNFKVFFKLVQGQKVGHNFSPGWKQVCNNYLT